MSTGCKTKTFNEFQRMQKCVADLIRCRSYLDQSAADNLEALEGLARKMEISAIVQQRNMIAVAGMQGTGKTTLIKNLYGIPDDFLQVNSNRGEQIPVFITEKSDLAEGEYSAKRVYFDEDLCRQEEEICANEVGKFSKARFRSAYVELFVPYRHFHTEQAGFVLLPGFEKNRDQEFDLDYNSLMEYTLYFANAVLLVTNDDGLANHDITVLLDKLGKNFTPHNCIFAITSCDGLSEEACIEQVETLIKACEDCGIGIQKEQIVCTGEYRTEEENALWKERLIDGIDRYLDYSSAKKEYLYFRPMMDEIVEQARQMGALLEIIQCTSDDDSPLYPELKKALKKAEDNMEIYLETASVDAQQAIADRFARTYGQIPDKHKKSKKFLLFNKRYEEIVEDRSYIRKKALATLKNPKTGDSELVYQIAQKLHSSSYYLEAQQHPQLLASVGGEIAQKTQAEIQERAVLCNTAVRAYLDSSAPMVTLDDVSLNHMSNVVANEFNTYFLSAVVGNLDLSKVPLRTEGIQATMARLEKIGKRQTSIVPFVGLADLLDGKCDIIQVVTNAFVSDPKKAAEIASVAGGYAVIAIAAVALAKKGLDMYNQSVTRQNAIGEAWEYALRNAVEEQKNNLIDSFREAADNLLEHVQRVHHERNGTDAMRSRIVAAKYALADITALSNSFNDKYAATLATRAQQK